MFGGSLTKTQHYFRYEKNGITTLNSELCGTKFLNPTGTFIYSLINGEREMEDIVVHMLKRYPSVEARILQAEVADFICSMHNMGFLDWEGVGEVREGCRLAGEADYKLVSELMLSYLTKTHSWQGYISANNPALYSAPAIRTRSFSANETYFIKCDNEKILALITVAGLDVPIALASIPCMLFSDLLDIKDLFHYTESSLSSRGILKIKIMHYELPVCNGITKVFGQLGFSLECTLTREVNGKDIAVYSKFTDGGCVWGQ